MGIRVSIEGKARNIIHEKGNFLTISRLSIDNCCVPISDVMIRYKKPENLNMFNEIKTENISLYVDKKLDFKNELICIKHSGFGPFRTVRVEGVTHF